MPGNRDASSSDVATLAELARDGSLDLTSVAFRVRTDLMVALSAPTRADLDSFLTFAAAALPKLGERDLTIITQKLAAWPHTPDELKAALALRLPGASEMFARAARRAANPIAREVLADLQPRLAAADTPRPAPLAAPHAVPPSAGLANAPALAQEPEPPGKASEPEAQILSVEARIDAARAALIAGDEMPARALLADAALGPAAHAAFFLIAEPVQQSLMLSGLAHLERSRPRRQTDARQRAALDRILDLAATDRAGAFLALSDAVGGTPEFAARITLDESRKLAGLCIVAIGGNDEDAVRFALRLADAPACSVPTIFALADMARQASPAVAARLVRAIGGPQIASAAPRISQHVPAADPSGTPQRAGAIQPGAVQPGSAADRCEAGERRPLSPQEAARRLLAG
jgi:hypothetical protein